MWDTVVFEGGDGIARVEPRLLDCQDTGHRNILCSRLPTHTGLHTIRDPTSTSSRLRLSAARVYIVYWKSPKTHAHAQNFCYADPDSIHTHFKTAHESQPSGIAFVRVSIWRSTNEGGGRKEGEGDEILPGSGSRCGFEDLESTQSWVGSRNDGFYKI